MLDPHAFAQSYESRDPDHTPTDAERALIEDAICGFVSQLTAVELTGAEVEAGYQAAKKAMPAEALMEIGAGELERVVIAVLSSLARPAEAKAEPVAWLGTNLDGESEPFLSQRQAEFWANGAGKAIPLYASPPPTVTAETEPHP